ncbi:MAG: ATP-binding protein [Elusimicrobia bacterium]|nr:ATP-binding protein [Elusimicrobiota bacterium]
MNAPAKNSLRALAEKLLRSQKPATSAKISIDLVKAVHELEVHKIELEMQNDELLEARHTTEMALNKYRYLYDYAPIGYCTMDDTGMVTEINYAGCMLFGVERSAVVNRRLQVFLPIDERQSFLSCLQHVYETQAPQVLEINIAHPEDAPFNLQFKISCAENTTNNDKRQCLVAITDITEQKLAHTILTTDKKKLENLIHSKAAELVNANEKLNQAKRLSDIGTLAATVAHELRSPLTAIQITTAILKRKDPDLLERIDMLATTIENKISESNLIINDLLHYSAVKPLKRETFYLQDLLNECLDIVDGRLASKLITIIKEFPSQPHILLNADQLQMRELFMNLLNNAADAVESRTGRIAIDARVDAEHIEIIINDNGSGIDKATLDKIFDPFFTTKTKGTGLGLSLCKNIVTAHDGTIAITSNKGTGTIVTIQLPVVH